MILTIEGAADSCIWCWYSIHVSSSVIYSRYIQSSDSRLEMDFRVVLDIRPCFLYPVSGRISGFICRISGRITGYPVKLLNKWCDIRYPAKPVSGIRQNYSVSGTTMDIWRGIDYSAVPSYNTSPFHRLCLAGFGENNHPVFIAFSVFGLWTLKKKLS